MTEREGAMTAKRGSNLGGSRRRWPVRVVTLLALVALTAWVLPRGHDAPRTFAQAASGPTVTLNPTKGASGATVSISAFGFPKADVGNSAVILWDGSQLQGTGKMQLAGCTGQQSDWAG